MAKETIQIPIEVQAEQSIKQMIRTENGSIKPGLRLARGGITYELVEVNKLGKSLHLYFRINQYQVADTSVPADQVYTRDSLAKALNAEIVPDKSEESKRA